MGTRCTRCKNGFPRGQQRKQVMCKWCAWELERWMMHRALENRRHAMECDQVTKELGELVHDIQKQRLDL